VTILPIDLANSSALANEATSGTDYTALSVIVARTRSCLLLGFGGPVAHCLARNAPGLRGTCGVRDSVESEG
jgi:hypothetical protein